MKRNNRKSHGRSAARIFMLAVVEATVVALWLPRAAQAQSIISLSPTTSPSAGQPGVTVINLIGSGFPVGTVSAGSVTVTLGPVTSGSGSSATTSATAVTTIIGSTRQVTFQIPTSLNVTASTNYQVSISGSTSSGETFSSGNPASLTINPPAQIISLTPNSGRPGQTFLVTIATAYTNFVQGATEVNFGAGIAVGGAPEGAFGPVTVTSPTTATAQIAIDPAATAGFRTVTVETGVQVASLTGNSSFTVGQGTAPVLVSVAPSGAQLGQSNLLVAITGQNTHFAQGVSVVSLGSGISVNSLTVASPTSLTALISVTTTAVLGTRTVTVSTGTEVTSLANGFTITQQSQGAGLSVSPGSGVQGRAMSVLLTGVNTHFVQGLTVARFGPSIMVGSGIAGDFGPVTVTSDTSATAQITILSSALPGFRTVTAQTGAEQASTPNGFQVAGAPSIIGITPASGGQGQTVAVAIVASYTNFAAGQTQASFGPGISVNGGPVGGFGPVSVMNAANGTAQLTITPGANLGPRTVTVRTGAEQVTAANIFSVLGPVTGAPPVASITSPTEATEVTAPITVTGTVTSPNLDTWTLDYQAPGQTSFTTFAIGTTAAVSGQFDPTNLLNGNTIIRLRATDSSGQSATPATVTVVVARNLKIGNFTVSFNDLTIPVAGLPIQVVRTYDSRNKTVGDFGVGWTLDLKTATVNSNGPLGLQWNGTRSSGILPSYCIVPSLAHVVTVVLPGGTTYEFQASANPQCQQLVPPEQVSISFTPAGDTPANAALAVPGSGQLLIDGSFPGLISLTNQDGTTFDPDQYQLTLPDGRVLQISRQVGLQTMTDLNGNTLTVGSMGITSSSGKAVTFARDAQNRITTITDPAGNTLTYSYASTGDLASFTDQMHNTSSYTYDSNHDLLTITDPSGAKPITNTYDATGRLVSHTDAFGNVINYANDPNTSQEVVTDALGNVTVNEYDSDGNIVRVTDALGGVTQRTYDSRDNLTSETNALGNTTTYTYDQNNNRLTETDPLGDTTAYTYNARNQVTSITDALSRETTNTYDSNGNLLSTQDAAGNVTSYTYNAAGQQISITDPLKGVTQFQYDLSGNLTKKTDALGNATTYTYDANGNKTSETTTRTKSSGPQTLVTSYQYDALNRLTQTTYPDGSITQIQYNPIGKQSVTIDQLNRQTAYQYDLMGRLTQTTYPDGTTQTSTYDADGNRVAGTDQEGRTTTYTYDPLNRLTKVTYPDGTGTSTNYDSIGEVTGVVDARDDETQYEYDAAGRRTKITDALDEATSFAYDAVGNQTSMTDGNGNTSQYAYDDLNRRTKVMYPDSTEDVTAYDALGRITSKTDEANRTTQYQYDALGRLVAVTDALGQVTKYTYDEVGNRISQTDANGHTTTFGYDSMGRRTSRILPLGMTETSSYDAAGNMKSHTDFNGKTTTFTYDALNRLASKVPDASFGAPRVTFTYTATGQRASMTDASGTTSYEYDLRDRLTQKATPEGTLSYTYDEAGNLTSIQSSNAGGTSVTYTYDALNRLASVKDSHTGTTSYGYDKAGNLQSYTYPNGITTTYTYNSLNRLTNVSVGPLASYAYTLGPTGNRTAVSELGGRNVSYAYDGLYRLTGETVTGSSTPSANGAIAYQYDPVGNRLQRTSTLTAVPPANYSYDQNDRLTSDSYDANGDTIASNGHTYAYDFENRLVSADGGATMIVYDGDGNRIAETVKGVGTRYLVDDRNLTGYAQVLEELSGGAVQRVYTYGLSRISETQSSGASFYGYDGHGNVRLLMNTAGAVTDRYDYDAFGNIISQSGTTPNVYRYSGEQSDPSLGFYYLRTRYLNTSTGRFVTADTFPGDPQAPVSLHKYLYTSANPINRIDPTGQQDTLLAALSADVAISQIVEDIAFNNVGPAVYLLWGTKTFLQPGFAMTKFALAMLSSGSLDAEEVRQSEQIYGLGSELISEGADWIYEASKTWKKIVMVVHFGKLAFEVDNSVRITPITVPVIRQWNETCTYLDEETKQIGAIIVPRASVDLETVQLLQPDFKEMANALKTAEALVVDLLKEWEVKHYVDPALQGGGQ